MKFSPRHLVWVNLLLLALVAYGGAASVSAAIAARLMPPPEVRLSAAPPPIEREPHRPAAHYAAISNRDIFNSAKPEPEPPKEPPKPTELKLKLWGVVVHRDQDSSYCVIEDLNTRRQELYRTNDVVAGVARVKAVEWQRVILDRDGREEILDLSPPTVGPPTAFAGGRPGQGPQVASVGPASGQPGGAFGAAPGGVPGAPAAADGMIEQLGEYTYAIDRSEVDAALDNMNQLFTQIRAVPHFEGGRSTGFRLFAIRQGSLFERIGLRNGDIVKRINGNPIDDPGKALALFNELRNQRDLSVEIERNKNPQTLSYTFR